MRTLTWAVLAASTLVSPAVLRAQAGSAWKMPLEYREVQVRALETQRKLLLSMADSMPENLYRDRVTAAQRDFAQQVHHAAAGAVFITARIIVGQQPPATLPDTAEAFNSRAGLKRYVNAAYDWVVEQCKSQTAEDRSAQASLFGQQMPKWQVWDEVNQHTIWTAGQVVANFRKHGMAPPPFLFF